MVDLALRVVGRRAEGEAQAGRGSRAATSARPGRLGAVLLGAPDAEGRWRYLGRAGSGLAGRRGADLARALTGLARATSPVHDDVPAADARGVTWCEPRVAVDVAYLQRTRVGRLRHPSVRALRTDSGVDPWEAP